eukprot:gnl/TRDRNA2_/TRDRNA2_42681_c0_seq1.p1 gnl/TRDRNA2_/TRDRNA2_42681_c0~~gnl/TRDRNA2_/TRDRNA2_42681_c0_seq1.p1  ORF type:complete len:491 (+),score=59.18 gnl/TRDRNA2_/TRDRNA2_42681_c0_seq1:50-1474(+)
MESSDNLDDDTVKSSSASARKVGSDHEQRVLVTFGQNIWGNLAVGNISSCPATTSKGPVVHSCPPMAVGHILPSRSNSVTLGATWTHLLDGGHLWSAGWAGDGACGFSPNVPTQGMVGEHVTELVHAADRWMADDIPRARGSGDSFDWTMGMEDPWTREISECTDKADSLDQISSAYTSSLSLSKDRMCVFTFGLAGDSPTMGFAIPSDYKEKASRTMSRPMPVFRASASNKVRQVVATYSSNFLVMENGDVLKAGGFDGQVSSSDDWMRVPSLSGRGVVKMAGTAWSHFGALDSTGSLLAWSAAYEQVPGVGDEVSENAPVTLMDGVADFALGVEHTLVLKDDGSLWSAGSNDCGQLGRKTGSTHPKAEDHNFEQLPGKWRAVCAGMFYSLAVDADTDSLYIWGSMDANTYHGGARESCTKDGETHSSRPMKVAEFFEMLGAPMPREVTEVESVGCGFYHAAAIVKDTGFEKS